MKKLDALSFALLFLLAIPYSKAQAWQWVKQGVPTNKADGRNIAVDAAGNVYTAGRFKSSVNLSGTTLTSAGGQDIFVAKHSPAGNLLWAVRAGGADEGIDDEVEGIAVDNSGNVYIVGTNAQNASFGSTVLASNNFYIARINSSGSFEWAKGSTGFGSYGWGVTVDNNGNPYALLDFDVSVTLGGNTYTAKGGTFRDIIVAALDPDGNYTWARQIGGDEFDRALDISYGGNMIYVTGTFQGDATFGAHTLTSTSGDDSFLAQFNLNGDVQWAKGTTGGTSQDEADLFINSTGQILLAGIYNGMIGISGTTLTTTANKDVFVARYASNGDLIKAAKLGMSGTTDMRGLGVAELPNGKVYLTGGFFGTLMGQTSKAIDIFLGTLDSNLELTKVSLTGANGVDQGKDIAVDNAGMIYLTGAFMQTVTFTGTGTLTAQNDAFTGKLLDSGTGIEQATGSASNVLSPNPSAGAFRISGISVEKLAAVRVYDITGRQVSFVLNGNTIELNAALPGTYFVHIPSHGVQALTLLAH